MTRVLVAALLLASVAFAEPKVPQGYQPIARAEGVATVIAAETAFRAVKIGPFKTLAQDLRAKGEALTQAETALAQIETQLAGKDPAGVVFAACRPGWLRAGLALDLRKASAPAGHGRERELFEMVITSTLQDLDAKVRTHDEHCVAVATGLKQDSALVRAAKARLKG